MNVTILCNREVHASYITRQSLDRLATFAEAHWIECDHPTSFKPLPDPDSETKRWILRSVEQSDAVIVCHGAPRLTADVLGSIGVAFIGELEGDRFSPRVDLDAAERAGIVVVDTTHGSSSAVAEWALALVLVSLRDAGRHFRRFVAGADVSFNLHDRSRDRGFTHGELRGMSVGLVGLGYAAQHLIDLLDPFCVTVRGYDPFVDAGRANALNVDLAALATVMSTSDVVVVLAPETPGTYHLIGHEELSLLAPGAVLVNVSRGCVVDPDALIERLRRHDLWAGLDVWDPDPCPPDSELRRFDEVFYTPHIAGVTLASRQRLFDLMVDELARFHNGVRPRAQLDRRVQAGRGASAHQP